MCQRSKVIIEYISTANYRSPCSEMELTLNPQYLDDSFSKHYKLYFLPISEECPVMIMTTSTHYTSETSIPCFVIGLLFHS
jgi:hypothetical protein